MSVPSNIVDSADTTHEYERPPLFKPYVADWVKQQQMQDPSVRPHADDESRAKNGHSPDLDNKYWEEKGPFTSVLDVMNKAVFVSGTMKDRNKYTRDISKGSSGKGGRGKKKSSTSSKSSFRHRRRRQKRKTARRNRRGSRRA
jgi:hypothetical protein